MLLVTLCVLVVATCVGIVADIARNQAVDRASAQMSAFSANITSGLDRIISGHVRSVTDVVGLEPLEPVFRAGGAPLRDMFEGLQRAHPEFVWIGFAGTDGRVDAATGGLLEGESVVGSAWFSDGLQRPTLVDAHSAELLSDRLPVNSAAGPGRLLDIALPVLAKDGRQIGVLGTHVDLAHLDASRAGVLATLDADLQNDLWILRADGRVLFGPGYGTAPLPPERINAITTGHPTVFIDDTGPRTITAATRMALQVGGKPLGWIVVARRPVATAFADADALSMTILGVGVLIALLASMLGVVLARRLTSPLRQLAEQVDRIGRTPDATMIEREHGSSDIRQLSTSIRALLRRLGTAEDAGESARAAAAQLQQHMDERTRRLGERISNLQVLADTDPLTQLLNRRAFLTFAEEAMVQFNRSGHDFGMLIIDIDHFKRVNDTYGHAVGDDVITFVSQAIEQEVRHGDKVARFGGEEFVVLLSKIDKEGVELIAERIRSRIASRRYVARDHVAVSVTASIGVALASRDDRDVSDLIERADRSLYAAKSGGRNQVIVARRAVSDAA
ncbi:diguanylate cyclase [Devosia sp.]|uniref:GGDEF domain-containing protein n=1 Tax=Devosia sp. TaxID=1871048 RepID=UPI003A9038FF